MTKDMTEGNALGLILRFALPLLVGNLLQQTYNMIDAAIVGRFLGTQALAGVGATSSVQFLVLGFCTGLCSGFGVPVARDFGANQFGRMRKDIFHGALLTAVIAVILTTGCELLCPWILKMLSVTEDIYGNARIYILIIFLGLPFTLLYNFLSSILRAVGDSRTPFLFLAFSACLNVVLDLICIIVFKWGCAGAAFATITAQAISGLCCLIFIIKKVQILHPKRKDCHLQPVYVKEMLVMGLPMGLQFSITAIGSVMLQSAVNSLGAVCVSGVAVASKIYMLLCCPFDALAMAATNFTGQNLGAGKYYRIRQGTYACLLLGIIYCAIYIVIARFGTQYLVLLFMNADEAQSVLDYTQRISYAYAYGTPLLLGVNVFRLSIQGMGYSRLSLISGLLEMIARTAVGIWGVPQFGFAAACLASPLAWALADCFLIPAYYGCLNARRRQAARVRKELPTE